LKKSALIFVAVRVNPSDSTRRHDATLHVHIGYDALDCVGFAEVCDGGAGPTRIALPLMRQKHELGEVGVVARKNAGFDEADVFRSVNRTAQLRQRSTMLSRRPSRIRGYRAVHCSSVSASSATNW
jgi:hypothetical protein